MRITAALLASLLSFSVTSRPGLAQTEAGKSGQRLEVLLAAEQTALDTNDPNQILSTARQLGFFGLQLLGSLYVGQDRCALASHSYRQALSVSDGPEMLQVHLETQMLLLTSELCSEHTAAADQISAEVLASSGNTPRTHMLLASARQAGDDLAGALVDLQKAIALAPQLGPAHLALGNVYWELNEFQYNVDSLREFTLARQLLPNDFFANENLGSLLSQFERYDEAKPYLLKAAELDPASPSPWIQLGMNAFAQNHAEQALTAFQKAVTLTGSNESLNSYQIRRVFASLSRLEAQRGDAAKAEAWSRRELAIRSAMALEDVSTPLTESVGVTADAAHQAQPDRARATNKTETISPENAALERRLEQIVAKSLNDAGTVYARSRDFAEALPMFRIAASADPDQPPFMRNLGLAAFHTADYSTAVMALTHALAQNPGDTLAQDDLAQARALASGAPAVARP